MKQKRYPKKANAGAPAAAVTAKMPKSAASTPLPALKTVYVKIANPNDHDSLLALKQLCGKHPGQNDIIMVLGSDKSRAIRLPFRVDAQRELHDGLVQILGDECVAIK